MAVKTADDRTLLLADFGITATVTPSGGSASDIPVIFDNEYISLKLNFSYHNTAPPPQDTLHEPPNKSYFF